MKPRNVSIWHDGMHRYHEFSPRSTDGLTDHVFSRVACYGVGQRLRARLTRIGGLSFRPACRRWRRRTG